MKLTLDEAGAANSIRDRSKVHRYVQKVGKSGCAVQLRKQCVKNHVHQHGKIQCAPCMPSKSDAHLFGKAVKKAGKRMANSDESAFEVSKVIELETGVKLHPTTVKKAAERPHNSPGKRAATGVPKRV